MTWADDDSLNDLAAKRAEIRLYLEQLSATEFREAWGGGYAPAQGKGERDGEAVVWKALFSFNGPVGTIRGYYLLIGGIIKESKAFDKPIPIAVNGDKIEVNHRVELE